MTVKKINFFITCLVIFQLFVPTPLLAAAVGHFTAVAGDVVLQRDGVRIRPVINSPIEVKDVIVTEKDSSTAMLFNDESTVILSPNSRFEVKEFTVQEESRQGMFFMAVGKLNAMVKKFIGGDSIFEVSSRTAVAGVRGTGFEFVVVSDDDEQETVSVICSEGEMAVSALSTTGAVLATTMIFAGQTAVISGGAIAVSAAAVGAAGAGAAGVGTSAAGAAGATAGIGTAAGITAGTVAAAAGIAAAAVVTVVETTGDKDTTTTHGHTTTSQHR